MAQRRFNPLTREWVLVSPHRTDRPWLGERSQAPALQVLRYDPSCYLCPGNERANGARNPQYTSTYVFPNDYPALTYEVTSTLRHAQGDMVLSEDVVGECRVLCFSPRHDLHLGSMPEDEI